MEAERDSFKRESQVQVKVQTVESLKTGNTELYEKVRYLQKSYSDLRIHVGVKTIVIWIWRHLSRDTKLALTLSVNFPVLKG
jgi:hypothetical protein